MLISGDRTRDSTAMRPSNDIKCTMIKTKSLFTVNINKHFSTLIRLFYEKYNKGIISSIRHPGGVWSIRHTAEELMFLKIISDTRLTPSTFTE